MIVKRQHLVWRKYLAPWTNSPNSTTGIIFLYDVVKKEVRTSSIENVGVQKYTYDISTLNETDKAIVTQYYEKWLNNQLKNLKCTIELNNSDDILKKDYIENTFITPIEKQGLSFLDKLYNKQFPFDGPTKLEITNSELKREMINCLFGNANEKRCIELMEHSKELCENPPVDNRFNFYEYLSVQMLRTWKFKNSILDAVDDTIEHFPETQFKDSTKAIFTLMMIINSEIIANALCENNFYIELIVNNTKRNFLTCDLPVINLCANYKDKKEVSDLVIYYPLKPNLAIVCKNSLSSNVIIEIDDLKIIDKYNNKIINAAEKQIYAKTKEDLEVYLK